MKLSAVPMLEESVHNSCAQNLLITRFLHSEECFAIVAIARLCGHRLKIIELIAVNRYDHRGKTRFYQVCNRCDCANACFWHLIVEDIWSRSQRYPLLLWTCDSNWCSPTNPGSIASKKLNVKFSNFWFIIMSDPFPIFGCRSVIDNFLIWISKFSMNTISYI